MIILLIRTTSLTHSSLKGWEDVRFELGNERVEITVTVHSGFQSGHWDRIAGFKNSFFFFFFFFFSRLPGIPTRRCSFPLRKISTFSIDEDLNAPRERITSHKSEPGRRRSTWRKISAFLVPFETGDETQEDGYYTETMDEGAKYNLFGYELYVCVQRSRRIESINNSSIFWQGSQRNLDTKFRDFPTFITILWPLQLSCSKW